MTDDQTRDNYFAQQTKTRDRPPTYIKADIRHYFFPTIYGNHTTKPTVPPTVQTLAAPVDQLLTAPVDRKSTVPTTTTVNKRKPLTDKQRKVFVHTHYIVNHVSLSDVFNFLQHKSNQMSVTHPPI